MDKPVYIGQAVLDLSKLVMYRLRYDRLSQYARRFGGEISVVAGDTDSFFLEVQGMSVPHQLLLAKTVSWIRPTIPAIILFVAPLESVGY